MCFRISFLSLLGLFLGCASRVPEYNTEPQSGTLYFTSSAYLDENYQAVDERGNRIVAPDGSELFVRMADFQETIVRGLIEAEVPDAKTRRWYELEWKTKVVEVHAEFQLYRDSIVDAPLPGGGVSSGREGWFVKFLKVSSAEWVGPAS